MHVRKVLNNNSAVAAALAVIGIVAAAWFGYTRFASATGGRSAPTSSFYTIDDGKTTFEDAVNRMTPYDYNGKQAVKAHVFDCSGKQTVVFLERFTDAYRKAVARAAEEGKSGAQPSNLGELMALAGGAGVEVKKPGEGIWVRSNTPDGQRIAQAKCADGSTPEHVR